MPVFSGLYLDLNAQVTTVLLCLWAAEDRDWWSPMRKSLSHAEITRESFDRLAGIGGAQLLRTGALSTSLRQPGGTALAAAPVSYRSGQREHGRYKRDVRTVL